MAQFQKVNGDYQPVQNFDSFDYTNNGLNAVVSAATVQPQGPKLQYFTVTGAGHFTGAQVNTIVQATQQLATIYIYEFTTGGSNDTLAMAVYPVAAWTSGTLETAVEAALTAAGTANNVTVTNTATFTN